MSYSIIYNGQYITCQTIEELMALLRSTGIEKTETKTSTS